MVLKGSCLCGAIQYEVDCLPETIGHCHCRICQKAHGAAFGTYTYTLYADFRFVAGEEKLTEYRSSPDATRTFCQVCGSTLQYKPDYNNGFGLAVATLDSDVGIVPTYQLWTRSKASWWTLDESLKSYEEGP